MGFLFPVLFVLLSNSGQPPVRDLVLRLESRYRNARTLEATFLERYAENGRTARVESGTAYFRRPGKMRWEYKSPENDVFVVDGKTAWFYVPADHTVTRVSAKRSTDLRTPLALLAGELKVSRVCGSVQLASSEPLRNGDAVFRCNLSRQERRGTTETESFAADADTALFEIAPDTGELVRIVLHQAGGIEVEFQFENWKMDPPLPDGMFRFSPPPGVAIVNGETPGDSDGQPRSRVLNR